MKKVSDIFTLNLCYTRFFSNSNWLPKSESLIFNIIRNLLYFTESERAERERKGDLDQYERVDGDRNQTSKALAVKKVVFVSSWNFSNWEAVIIFWKLLKTILY